MKAIVHGRLSWAALALVVLVAGCPRVPTRPAELLPLVEIQVSNTPATIDDYVTWSPTWARARLINRGVVRDSLLVVLQNMDTTRGGQLRFALAQSPWPAATTATSPSITVGLRADGSWTPFVIAGAFGHPSIRDKDAVIEAREVRKDGVVLGRHALMVRVRKNANTLSAEERDRFLRALAKLNLVFGTYAPFQLIHSVTNGATYPSQAHHRAAFLPWHRAFLLRLERELQAVDPAVTLPYWRFDQPAPNVFNEEFMGVSDQPIPNQNVVRFAPDNPLRVWAILGLPGVLRRPAYLPTQAPSGLNDELTTLALGAGVYGSFRFMENNPHDPAHTTTGGPGNWLYSISTAVQDPLFFLLHTNVDRLWAKWEYTYGRYDPSDVNVYSPQGSHPVGTCPDLGHYLLDTMWPWNGATSPTDPCRPSTAPDGPLPLTTPGLFTPPPQPRPFDLIEYRMHALNISGMGFAYDDVPFN